MFVKRPSSTDARDILYVETKETIVDRLRKRRINACTAMKAAAAAAHLRFSEQYNFFRINMLGSIVVCVCARACVYRSCV